MDPTLLLPSKSIIKWQRPRLTKKSSKYNQMKLGSNSNATVMPYKQKRIEHLLVLPGSHQQNGQVERVHLTILNLVWTYLTDCTLPPTFWVEAASYAADIQN
jgi:hypothetical protein